MARAAFANTMTVGALVAFNMIASQLMQPVLRLGFNRAIVLLEDGCEEFSNITGLGQIRFPKGDITAKFEEYPAGSGAGKVC